LIKILWCKTKGFLRRSQHFDQIDQKFRSDSGYFNMILSRVCKFRRVAPFQVLNILFNDNYGLVWIRRQALWHIVNRKSSCRYATHVLNLIWFFLIAVFLFVEPPHCIYFIHLRKSATCETKRHMLVWLMLMQHFYFQTYHKKKTK
jgi:hypothetical protein